VQVEVEKKGERRDRKAESWNYKKHLKRGRCAIVDTQAKISKDTRKFTSPPASILHGTNLITAASGSDVTSLRPKSKRTVKLIDSQGALEQASMPHFTSPLKSQKVDSENESEEAHEQELDRLMTLHLAKSIDRKQVAESQKVQSPITTLQTIINTHSVSLQDFANADADVAPTIEFLLGLQNERSILNQQTSHLEAQIEQIRHRVFKLDSGNGRRIAQLEEKLRLASTLCFGLFVAEYAFRDVVDQGRVGLDEALEELVESVTRMVATYDGGMERLNG
jgi:hypothetical protein